MANSYLHILPIFEQCHQTWGKGKDKTLYPRIRAQLDRMEFYNKELVDILSTVTYPLPASRSP